ncbi:hypothetical protein MNBD_GAMMA26-59 [hydrothermal vent metagenome]|uniref:Uncharacterized protein n=1 Tax=hydrothermal vent metagenome TaxID=652676 RepID=A0A3B1BHY1_9ZZZZ
MKTLVKVALIGTVLWFVLTRNNQVTLGPGVLAPNSPKQVTIQSPRQFSYEDYTITPLAKFQITAKILAKKKYSSGRESDLSPVDLALGWGRMSDESVLSAIDISQSNRWYRWWTDEFPIPRKEIETNSANMHIVPADESILSAINHAQAGEIIELRGKLIRVDAPDGWHWASSLTRNDTGKRACELIWVEAFEVQ